MNFINWLVTSSADPDKFSMAVSGAVTVAGAFLLHAAVAACGVGLYCFAIDQEWLNAVIVTVTRLAYAVAVAIGAVMTIVGLIRKLHLGRWSAASL